MMTLSRPAHRCLSKYGNSNSAQTRSSQQLTRKYEAYQLNDRLCARHAGQNQRRRLQDLRGQTWSLLEMGDGTIFSKSSERSWRLYKVVQKQS